MLKTIAMVSAATVFSVATAIAETDAEVLERIRPIGKVNVKEAVSTKPVEVVIQPPAKEVPTAPVATVAPATPPVAPSVVSVGQKTYESICFACHAVGAANAPKFADKAAWGPRIAKGAEVLLQSTIKGTAAGMPPRGSCGTCTDDDLKAAVEYMVLHGK